MCDKSKMGEETPTLSDMFTARKDQVQHNELIPNSTLAVIPTTAELADTEAEAVIQAVEPILKKCKKKKVIRPKSINLFRDQPLNVKLENGVTLTLNFAIPEN